MSVKAFELVSALERIKLMSDKAKTQIECIEVCGKNLYIGTSDCFIIHYILQESTASSSGKVLFSSEKQQHKYLGVKKPIAQLKAASALNRILVLCDNVLTLLNMFNLEPITSGAKVKGVTSFCLNENPTCSNPFSVEICVSLKKKQVQVYTVTEDRIMHVKDVSLNDQVTTLGLDGCHICAAMTNQYCMINYKTGDIQDLFPYNNEHTKAIVKRIGKGDFLLGGPSSLGMFVTSDGISQRPPLQWSHDLVSVGYVHPYIVALNSEFITVHSILDQQQKQAIPFQGGCLLGDFDGRIFVSSSKEIYALVPVAWEKQIQALLADKRVTEALDLAKNSNRTGVSKEKFLKMLSRIQQQAAFIEFSLGHFSEAHELFRSGGVDVKELISLYPRMLMSSCQFTRSVPPLHDIADVNQLTKGDNSKLTEYKEFLQLYLEEIKHMPVASGNEQVIDTALVKLYSENKNGDLLTLVAIDPKCELADSAEWLEKYHCYHPLAMLYYSHRDYDKALQTWMRLISGELNDDTFPGLDFVVEILANLNEHSLVWKYVERILQIDQEMGVKVFTERSASEEESDKMAPDTIVDFLHSFPLAVVFYLEFLVFQKKLQREKYHTHLAVLYLDHVLKLQKDSTTPSETIDIARSKLRHLLQVSDLYRVQLILGKAREMNMHAECAILYGKLEEHDKALKILVHKLKDYGAAENYCLVNAKDAVYKRKLFHILLSVYLDPSYERRDILIPPAIALLNSNVAEFDSIKVLQLLPEHWSVSILSHFLSRSIRRSINNSRTKNIERMLARCENLSVKHGVISLQKEPIIMTDDRLCAVCKRSFSDSTFLRYPNGIISHIHCAKNPNICPVTGKLFSLKKS
ncbi:growth factor-beta receptor-associated 1-like [Octopus vulgaris]|uniref:Growth factor-beta receptor-associated 1-like n=2 Tax=Octopus TaxID=6643 RepID=A0AA36F8K5_OCTVU|nr:transforming growth factor-beta receptor-associated protein 1 [Octopus sinensis]CAI9729846.1 growth factor-beta receptor-associated 1-like [Octopus vulgaris]